MAGGEYIESSYQGMNDKEYKMLLDDFDPCEYCQDYFECTLTTIKESEDISVKHTCSKTRRNFLRIYE